MGSFTIFGIFPFFIAILAKFSVSPHTYLTLTPGNNLSILNNFPKAAVCEFSAPIIPMIKGFILFIPSSNIDRFANVLILLEAIIEKILPSNVFFTKDRLENFLFKDMIV